ncbi:hypothetical protein Tco_0562637 [Tanacetum coccineum]
MCYLCDTTPSDWCKMDVHSRTLDLALYDNESWNDPRDFAKSVKAISLPQDVPGISNHRLVELENQILCLMEAHLAPKQSVQVNKLASSCEICGGPHDTQYCMENPEQAFVDYASLCKNEVGDSGALPNKGIIKSPSKLFSLKYQAESSLGEENRNSSSPKRVHFVNTITIVRKEDEPKETEILESCAINNDDHNLVVGARKTIEKEPKVSKIMKEEGESGDTGNDDKKNDLENKACKHETELGKEEEWMEYEQPLDLVDVRDESVYESLIEKMPSYSLNFEF